MSNALRILQSDDLSWSGSEELKTKAFASVAKRDLDGSYCGTVKADSSEGYIFLSDALTCLPADSRLDNLVSELSTSLKNLDVHRPVVKSQNVSSDDIRDEALALAKLYFPGAEIETECQLDPDSGQKYWAIRISTGDCQKEDISAIMELAAKWSEDEADRLTIARFYLWG